MSNKIKPRQQKKPRNLIVRDMFLRGENGKMRDRRARRAKG